MVFCGLPNGAERLSILQAASRSLPVHADVCLADVAARTQGFTGADLAAILSEAQLLAVHEQLDKSAPGQQQQPDGGDGQALAVTAAHMMRALARARPSLPPQEAARLAAVYSRFQAGRDPGLSNRPVLPEGAELGARQQVKHATLA
jgi:peroxin-1